MQKYAIFTFSRLWAHCAMEKFNSVELLYRSSRSMAVEGESTFLGTAHAPNRSIRSNRPNSFTWKLGFKRYRAAQVVVNS